MINNNDGWKNTNDHSKVIVAVNKSIVCIGDINHMDSQ